MIDFPDVDLIRRAAAAMRARAKAANTDDARRPYSAHLEPVPENEWGDLVVNYLGGPIGEHCAAWNPAVALAVAAWLDTGANPYGCVDRAPMVVAAAAYLGEPVSRCTGVSARWCPVHGDCSCPDDVPGLHLAATLDDPTCPLHKPSSSHYETGS